MKNNDVINCSTDSIGSILQSQNRLVVIVGAGVSSEAGIASTGDVIRNIFNGTNGTIVKRIVEQSWGDAEKAGFFRVLAVYRDVVGEEIFWRFLKTELKHDETSKMKLFSESYDLLAHLLHYSKVSAIISLNFDELLDRTIELESQSLNASDSIRPVASLSEFAAVLDELERYPSKIPNRMYFKPHGTIGRPLTIRVSEDTIRHFEPVKKEVMSAYLDDANVIALGWGLRDPDLLALLNNSKRPTENSKVVVVVKDAIFQRSVENFEQIVCPANRFLKEITARIEFPGSSTTISRNPSEPSDQKVLGTLRHQIRGAFFGKTDVAKPLFEPDTETQAALEILILALKARGHFAPHVLLDCPRTARLFLTMWEDRVKHPPLLENYKTPIRIELPSLLKRLSEGNSPVLRRGLNNSGEPVYWLNVDVKSETSDDPADILRIIATKTFDLFTNNVKTWNSKFCAEALDLRRADLVEWFTDLTQTFDIDIGFSLRHISYFPSAAVIRNRSELEKVTIDLLKGLEENPRNKLLVSTYTGEWLKNSTFRPYLENHFLELLVDDFRQYMESPYSKVAELKVKQIEKTYAPRIKISLVKEKAHNMTILTDENNEFNKGIYFHRELKTTQVCPVYIEDKWGMEILKGLWEKMCPTEAKGTHCGLGA